MRLVGTVYYQNHGNASDFHGFDNIFFSSGITIGESGFLNNNPPAPFTLVLRVSESAPANIQSSSGGIYYQDHLSSYTDFVRKVERQQADLGIWIDPLSKRISLYREAFGSVPLFYIHKPGINLVFSTSITALLENIRQYPEVNIDKIVHYTSFTQSTITDDPAATYLCGIKAVLPGHFVTIDSNKITNTPAFTPDISKWRHLHTPNEFADATREVIKRSVQRLIPPTGNIGSHLSGGLDSSSIISTVRFLNPERSLYTYHLTSESTEADERIYAQHVSQAIQSSHFLVLPALNDLEVLKLTTSLYGQPGEYYLSPATSLSTISLAADHGCAVLFNGHGGDAIVGNGFELMTNAFRERNWQLLDQLLRQRLPYHPLRASHPNWDRLSFEKQYNLVLNSFLYRQFSPLRHASFRELVNVYRDASTHLALSGSYFIKRAVKNFLLRSIKRSFRSEGSLISADLINSNKSPTTSQSFTDALRGELPTDYKDLFDEVFHPHVIRSQEQSFVLSSHFSVINRSPYMQKEFFELALAIPNEIKFGHGIGRAHLRDAMKGILAEEVRTRGTKATMSSLDGQVITQRLLEQARDYMSSGQEVWGYLDKNKFDQQAAILNNSKIPFTQKTASYFHITRAISLSVWLEWVKAQKKGH